MKPAGQVDLPQMSIDTSEVEERQKGRASGGEVMRGGPKAPLEYDFAADGVFGGEDEEPLPLPEDQYLPEKEASVAEEPVQELPRTEDRFRPTKNTKAMFAFLARKFEEAPASSKGSLSFNTLFSGRSAHAAAVGFFELLSLKSKNGVDLKQKEAYGDIFVKKAKEFDHLQGIMA